MAAPESVLADVAVAYYKDSAVRGGLLEDMVQIGKDQPAAVDRSPPAAAYSAAGRVSGGAVEDMAPAPGGGTVEEQAARMGLVVRMVAHSKDRLKVAHTHNLDLVEALVHSLGRMAQVDDVHIGCMLEA